MAAQRWSHVSCPFTFPVRSLKASSKPEEISLGHSPFVPLFCSTKRRYVVLEVSHLEPGKDLVAAISHGAIPQSSQP